MSSFSNYGFRFSFYLRNVRIGVNKRQRNIKHVLLFSEKMPKEHCFISTLNYTYGNTINYTNRSICHSMSRV